MDTHSHPTAGPAPQPDRHPNVEEISALTEGLLSPPWAAEVRQHCATCPECAELRAGLGRVTTLLGAQNSAAVPEAVAGRIDAAIRAEVACRSPGARAVPVVNPGPGPVAPAEPAAPGDPPRVTWRRRSPTVLRVAAAVLAVVSGGAGGLAVLTEPDESPLRSTAVDRPANSVPPADLASPGVAGARASDRGGSARVGEPNPEAPPDPRAYTDGDLAARVTALLATSARRRGSAEPNAGLGIPGPSSGLDAAQAVPLCVLAGIGRPEVTPVATDLGTYQGAPAAVVVLPGEDPARLDVYVVDSRCTSAPGRVMRLQRIARP